MVKKKVNALPAVIIIIALALFLGFVAMNMTGFSISGNESLSDNFSAESENISINVTSGEYNVSEDSKNGGLSVADKKTCPDDGWYNSSEPYWVNTTKCEAELRQYLEYRVYDKPPHCNYNITGTNYSVLGYLNNDSDGDGACDYGDLCGETVPWYAGISLSPNHYDSSNWNASDAYGCSCGQILDLTPGENEGEYDYGCSEGTVYVWMSKIGWTQDLWQKELRSWLLMPLGINNQPQNMTFIVNAIAQCFASDCGVVNGTLLYNMSSTYPTTIIPTSRTSKPFYVIGQNPQTCGQMNQGNVCNLTWIVNTTGAIGESYKIHTTFNSSLKSVESSTTFYTVINIIAPTLSIILSDDLMNVKFSPNLAPGSTNNSAINNSGNGYSIICEYSPGRCNVSIKANGDMIDGIEKFFIGNVSWNQANSLSGVKRMNYNYHIINATLGHMVKQYIYFWLDVPVGQIYGNYRSNFTIEGLPN